MNDENDKPKNQPEDDWAMTTPNLRLEDEIKAGNPPADAAPRQSADDWGVTEPNIKIPQNQSLSSDFGETAPNFDISETEQPPRQASDDWMMSNPNAKIPKEGKTDGWEMPTPVFRVSSGTEFTSASPQNQPNFEKSSPNADFSSERSVGNSSPHSKADEQRREKTGQISAPQTKKSAKVPLIFGGIFLMFFIGTAFLLGVYFLFLNKTESPRAVNPTKTNTASKSNSAPVSNQETSSNLPVSIDYKSEMVLVPAGEFTMGDDAGEDISKPAHAVTLPAFYIDKYEVTNARYKEFCDATGKTPPIDPEFEKGYFLNRPNAPVMGISFDDAKAYAEWEGKRLPTEEEWEKAASWDETTKTKREFPWGNDFTGSPAAFKLPTPSDVGEYALNVSPFGAMDMAGNVFEWVDSYFKPYPGSKAASGEFGEKNRIVRGGYFGAETNDALKTTKRIYAPANTVTNAERESYIGFRCAISADDARLKDFLTLQGK